MQTSKAGRVSTITKASSNITKHEEICVLHAEEHID